MLGPLLLGTAIYCTELWKHNKKALVSASFCLLTILCVGRFFSELLPNRDYYSYSPGDATSYKPFEITVIDSIPHGIDSFFLIQSENDSSKINNNYAISDELLLKEKSIRLLNRIK